MRTLTVFLLLLLLLPLPATAREDVTVYVNSHRDYDTTVQRWQATIDRLNEKIPDYHFILLPIPPNNVDSITSMLAKQKIDFLITQPAITTSLQYSHKITPMLTMVNGYGMNAFGSVFIVNKNRPYRTIMDLKGKRFAAVAPMGFGGWLIGYNELVDEGLDPLKAGRVAFLGSQSKVVEAILAGEYDAGVIRTGMLEKLAANDSYDLSAIRIINRKEAGYPVAVSTSLFPEWSLSRAPHVDLALAEKVFKVMSDIEPQELAAIEGEYRGWGLVRNHADVDLLFKRFRIGHYSDVPEYDLATVIYSVAGVMALLLTVGVLVVLWLKVRMAETIREELEAQLAMKENMLIRQSRNSAMGEMLTMIAHQWRQPLATISMAVNNAIANKELGIDEGYSLNELEKIQDHAVFLSETIDDFRNFFRSNEAKSRSSVMKLVDMAVSFASYPMVEHEVTLVKNVPEALEATVYPNEVTHVVLNLLQNAIEAFSPGVRYREIRLRAYAQEGMVIIEVCDNAGGVDALIIDQIFDPYFTTKQSLNGSGLGLYMCKNIIELHHNGTIAVKNGEEGACFTVTLPADG
jgi:signal transduction histidine kinase